MADQFVNKTELFEEIGPLLEDVFSQLRSTAMWIKPEAEKPYHREELKRTLGYALGDLEKAETACQGIWRILDEVREIHGNRKAIIDRSDKRVKMLTVIIGKRAADA